MNVMVDIETWGNAPGCMIKTIGAVKFDDEKIDTNDTFYGEIDDKSCEKIGLKMDIDTIHWWMSQKDEARQGMIKSGTDIITVLSMFGSWLGEDADKILLWGNGSDFDNTILAYAYRAAEIEQPWKFYNNRCYRTMKNMYPDVKLKRKGVHHNALNDAITQAEHLVEILKCVKSPDCNIIA